MMHRVARVALVTGCAVLLSACAGSSGEGGRSTGRTLANVIFLNDPNPPPAAAPQVANAQVSCPAVEILPGTSTLSSYDRGGEGNPSMVRYQAAINETARECVGLGLEVAVRVGVRGRLIAGPRGGAGSMDLPLRVSLVDENGTPVFSNLTRIRATIPQGATAETFTHVEEGISMPIPENRMRGYRIVVGFDAQGRDAPRAGRR